MKMDYSHKRQPYIDGIYNIYIKSPGYVGAGKTTGTFNWVSISKNCKTIFGVSQSG